MVKRAFMLFLILSAAGMVTSCLLPPTGIQEGAGDTGVLTEENNLLGNSTFPGKTYLPWTTSFTAPGVGSGKVVDGAFCLEVENKGKNNWDAQFRHREMVIQRGHRYYLQFKIWSSQPMLARPKVGMAGPPYAEYWFENIKVNTEPQIFSANFVMTAKDDPTAEFAFHVGGEMAAGVTEPYTVCIDDIMLADPEFKRTADSVAAPIPNVFVNQTGYLPQYAKFATVKTDSTSPVKWEVINGENKTLAKGETIVYGEDKASGDTVHIIDFSSFSSPGEGYRVVVGSDKSAPFDIRKDIYSKMKYDALHFFYHQRQGIPIEMPYAEDKKWTRPAGHPLDTSVACLPKDNYYGTKTPYEPCNYKLDVSQGWYDAGDHGKYVVNGGATVWSLLNLYERAKYLGTSVEDFGDGKINIPEQGNGVPDILDEVRWELEFFLKMQVPEGNKFAGMVHHKMHSVEWTGLAIWPHEDEVVRYLHPPTTTATLNMAATAAMAARIWEKFDPDFSKKCLAAAEKAWKAAKANPEMWASSDAEHGGGPYDDDKVDDEFYWAAAELFITTGKEEYKKEVVNSPHYKVIPSMLEYDKANGTFTWKDIAPTGSLSLATVPNKLPKADIEAIRENVKTAGDEYIEVIAGEGYRLPLSVKDDGRYPWGANSNVVNALQVTGLAYDFSKDAKYIDAVATGMDYLMGRNAMDTSYVTGYGERPVKNPHHRFWAHQADARFPGPPPGVLSGGPNSGIEDPCAKAAGLEGCKPMKCFIDHIDSWSTNEITINWNAPLAWVAAFLDEVSEIARP
jgi:endoglucanase